MYLAMYSKHLIYNHIILFSLIASIYIFKVKNHCNKFEIHLLAFSMFTEGKAKVLERL